MAARIAMSWPGSVATIPMRGGGPEHDEADGEQQPAAEPIAEGAGEEKQPGEHDGVGVDDPGEVGLAGTGLTGEARKRDVEAGHGGDDRHERQADDGEDEARASGGEGRCLRASSARRPPASVNSSTGEMLFSE